MKKLSLLFGSLSFFSVVMSAQTQLASFECDFSINSMCWLADSRSVIVSNSMGEVARYDVYAGEKIWQTTLNSERQELTVFDVSPDGTQALISGKTWSDGATKDLLVVATENGKVLRRISETSLYVQDPEKAEATDLRFKEEEEYPSYEMACFRARYLPDGKILATWCNFQMGAGQYDRCFKLYSASGQRLWHSQIVSMNNYTFRNGNNASYIMPAIDGSGSTFYYGDSDADFYQLSESHIKAQEQKLYITDKAEAKKILARPLDENIGIGGVCVRGSKVFVLYVGSGSPSFVAVFENNRLSLSPVEIDADFKHFEVSKEGVIALDGFNDTEIYNSDMSEKIGTLSGHHLKFNPNNARQVVISGGAGIEIYEF